MSRVMLELAVKRWQNRPAIRPIDPSPSRSSPDEFRIPDSRTTAERLADLDRDLKALEARIAA